MNAFEPRILRFDLLRVPDLADRHAGVFALPLEVRRRTEAMLAAGLGNLRSATSVALKRVAARWCAKRSRR